MRLFDDCTRSRATFRTETESDYQFLNTSAFRFAGQVRHYTQQWFDRYPEEARADCRGRFVSGDDQLHMSAHFELFLHELLSRLGFDIEVHPSIAGVDKHPDFRIRYEDIDCYLEAVVIHSTSGNRTVTQHEKLLKSWLEDLDGSNFWLHLRVRGALTEQPKKRNLHPVRDLLASNHPDDVERVISTYGYQYAPHTDIVIGAWTLRASLIPRPEANRGNPDAKTIGVGPGAGGSTNTVAVTEKIAEKATEKKSNQLDAPLLIAAKVMDDFYDVREDAVPTLLGWPESNDPSCVAVGTKRRSPGVWLDRNGQPQYRSLHAVWMFERMPTCSPSPTAHLDSALVINPTIAVKLPQPFYRLSHFLEGSGNMYRVDGANLDDLLDFQELPREQWDELV